MNNKNDKTAFPIVADSLTYICDPGMTLRDYFAAKAMQAIIQSDKYMGVIGVNGGQFSHAQRAYEMADAMLKAREE